MAIFRIISDLLYDSYDAMLGETVLQRSQTMFQYTNAGGFVVSVIGTNFTFDTEGIPTGGDVTRIAVDLNGVRLSLYTGLTYNLATLNTQTFGTVSGSTTVVAPDFEALFAGLRFGNDEIFGNAQGRDITGYDGNDTIHGGGGDDWLGGGAGIDRFYGDDGMDGVYFGFSGNPLHGARVDLRLASGNIIDDGHGNTETATSVERYDGTDFADSLLAGIAADVAFWGGGGNDTLNGGGGIDYLYGGDGRDSLIGSGNNDILQGGRGIDRFNGGMGIDVLAFWGPANHGVTVNLSLAGNVVVDDGFGNSETALNFESVGGSEQGDRLTGNGAGNEISGNDGRDVLSGLGGVDWLYGGAGGDRISGGAGNDLIYGGSERDALSGGPGADEFVFLDNEIGFDLISDFVPGVDKISIFSGLASTLAWPELLDYQFLVGPGMTSANSTGKRVIYDTTSHSLYIDPDGLGGVNSYKIAELTNGAFLTLTDFWVIN